MNDEELMTIAMRLAATTPMSFEDAIRNLRAAADRAEHRTPLLCQLNLHRWSRVTFSFAQWWECRRCGKTNR